MDKFARTRFSAWRRRQPAAPSQLRGVVLLLSSSFFARLSFFVQVFVRAKDFEDDAPDSHRTVVVFEPHPVGGGKPDVATARETAEVEQQEVKRVDSLMLVAGIP